MKQKIQSVLDNPLISGSSTMFLGTLFANVFNFLFTIYMYANLPPGEKGTLIAIISLITLPALIASAVTPSVLSFAGKYFANDEIDKVHGLYSKIGKAYLFLGIGSFLLILVLIPTISAFFQIEDHFLLVIADFIILLQFFIVLNNAFLQAKLAFGSLAFITITSTVTKFILGVILIISGFAIKGAVGALFLSFLIPFVFTFYPLRSIFQSSVQKINVNAKEFFSYGLPAAIASFGLTSFITSDILLVKHFFEPEVADIYGGISVIGRIIFYFSSPIASVMFPLVVQRMSRKENYTSIFTLSMLLVLLASSGITLLYFLYPQFFMDVFKIGVLPDNEKNLLGIFALFISVYALVSILVHFYLSIKKTIIFLPIVITAVLQIACIWFFHTNFLSIIYISLFCVFLLLVVLLLYYPYATRER